MSALKDALRSLAAVVERQQARIAELEAANARLLLAQASEGLERGVALTEAAAAAAEAAGSEP